MKETPTRDQEKTDRRRVPRYRAPGVVELAEAGCEKQVSARIIELSMVGCRVYIGHRLLKGTSVKLRITHNQEVFEATGEVVWSGASGGTGIAFRQFSAEHEQVLEKWVAALAGVSP